MEKEKFIKEVKEVDDNFTNIDLILSTIITWMKDGKTSRLFIPGKYITLENDKIKVNGNEPTSLKEIQALYYDVREVFVRSLFN